MVIRYRNQVLIVACVLLAGCHSAPVYNITEAPVTAISGKQVTLDGVRDAIIRAGTVLGWQMDPVALGVISARLNLRDHGANVDVRYNTKSYSIVYRDSSNLNYQNGQIHKNYNGWIQNLDREIRNQILRI